MHPNLTAYRFVSYRKSICLHLGLTVTTSKRFPLNILNNAKSVPAGLVQSVQVASVLKHRRKIHSAAL